MYTKQEIIIRSHREGKSQRQIAREFHVSHKTVRKYLFDYESDLTSSGNKESTLSKYLSKPIPVFTVNYTPNYLKYLFSKKS